MIKNNITISPINSIFYRHCLAGVDVTDESLDELQISLNVYLNSESGTCNPRCYFFSDDCFFFFQLFITFLTDIWIYYFKFMCFDVPPTVICLVVFIYFSLEWNRESHSTYIYRLDKQSDTKGEVA